MTAFLKASCCAALLAATVSCAGSANDAIEKAQIAVRANPSLELVATDERQGVLTVRVVRSGRMLTVKAADVVAGTAFRDLDADAAASQTPAPAAPAAQPAPVPASGGATASGGSEAPPASQQRTTASNDRGQVAVNRSGGGLVVESPRGRVSIDRGGITATRPDRSVAVTRGPSPPASAQPPAAAPDRQTPEARTAEPAGREAASNAPRAGANIDESRLQRRPRTVACVGREVIELTDVLLRTDSVAVMASGDCEVRIKNSHIVGSVGVQAAGGGNVTIENSIIEGPVALQLAAGGIVSVQSSTIRGQVQRAGAVTLRDQGGNLFR